MLELVWNRPFLEVPEAHKQAFRPLERTRLTLQQALWEKNSKVRPRAGEVRMRRETAHANPEKKYEEYRASEKLRYFCFCFLRVERIWEDFSGRSEDRQRDSRFLVKEKKKETWSFSSQRFLRSQVRYFQGIFDNSDNCFSRIFRKLFGLFL